MNGKANQAGSRASVLLRGSSVHTLNVERNCSVHGASAAEPVQMKKGRPTEPAPLRLVVN
jgi:hypothetical protein